MRKNLSRVFANEASTNNQSGRNTAANDQPTLRISRYENMNELARLFFAQHSELLPPSSSSRSKSRPNLNNSSDRTISSSHHSNINPLPTQQVGQPSLNNNNAITAAPTTRKPHTTSQKQQKLNSIEHTLKTPTEWKEGLSNMAVILVNMIEDNNIVRLTPESRLALLINGSGDSSEYLSILPSHKPQVSGSILPDRKLSYYIKCKFNDKYLDGETITRGSSQFIEMNIGSLYSKFFPVDNIAKYETQKLIELEICDGKQTRNFSFNCCKPKTKHLKRATIIYGVEEGRIKNQVLNNEEKVRSSIDRLSDQSNQLSPSAHNSATVLKHVPEVKPTLAMIPNQQHQPTIVHTTSPTIALPSPSFASQPPTQPRKITREILDHSGRVTNIITEYYHNESPKTKINHQPSAVTSSSKEVISIDDDFVFTPSRKKRKANNVNKTSSVILIEDEEKPVKTKQEVVEPQEKSPNTPKKTISFSSIINLDD